jgi:hypothetical protein
MDTSPLAALRAYIDWCGGVHDEHCPEDDTCSCSGKWINDGLNEAIRILQGPLSNVVRQTLLLLVQEKRSALLGFSPDAAEKGYAGRSYTPADVERALEWLQAPTHLASLASGAESSR